MIYITKVTIAAAIAAVVVGCTTGDKGSTPADTVTSQSTTVAPAATAGPVLSAPVPDTPPVQSAAKPVPSRPKSVSRATVPAEPPMRDSAFKPRATVDDRGNIQPIKRDTLR